MALQSDLTAKIKSAEAEKENLLSKIRESSEMTDKIKLEYGAIVVRSLQHEILFYQLMIVTLTFRNLSLVQERHLIYAEVLLPTNKIVADKFNDCFSETSKLSAALSDTLESFGKLNLLELTVDQKIPDVFSGFDQHKYEEDLKRLGESLALELIRSGVEGKADPMPLT